MTIIVSITVPEIRNFLGLEPNEKDSNKETVSPEAWYNKGDALRKLGRIEEAIEAYNTAKELE